MARASRRKPGPQLIEIPAVVGMSPRAAEINLRRRGLEVGDPAELPTNDSAPQAILAQTPSPGAQGVASPGSVSSTPPRRPRPPTSCPISPA